MTDYGEMCRDIREARRDARAKHGVSCPRCAEARPKAQPSILLPQQRCKVDGYRDPRPRTRDTEYLTASTPTPSDAREQGEG